MDKSTGQVMDGALAGPRNQSYYDSLFAQNKNLNANATDISKNLSKDVSKIGSNAGIRTLGGGTNYAKNSMNAAYQSGLNAGAKFGRTMGRIGMAGAAVGGTYLLGKGLGLWGNNKKED